MAQKVIIPRLGQTMTEGTVGKWFVPDGETVAAGQDLYEMEYDKSTANVQAKRAGTLRHLVAAGAVVPVGQPVGVILEAGETLESVDLRGHEVANSALAGKKDIYAVPAAQEKPAADAPQDADVIVIGGGPGGYVCALKAAMLGAKVILVERDAVGGTCLNRGCIPTKALLQSAELYEHILDGGKMGINAADVTVDFDKVDAYRGKVVTTLVKGVEGLLKARKVELVRGEAVFTGEKTLEVSLNDGGKRNLTAPAIVIAAGSKSAAPPIPGLNGSNVITSTEALDVKNLPQSMAIIGGGVIGMEIGAVYAAFGVKITVIEALPRILPNMDEEISSAYTAIAKKKMEIHTAARVSAIEDAPDGGKLVRYTEADKEQTAAVDVVLVAVGRTPDTKPLQVDKAGIVMDRARVVVDDAFETNVKGVYCIGDANAKTMLAHVASAQGVAVAERITGHTPAIAQHIIPSCIYTDPEIASVGLTEAQVKDSGREYKVGKFSLRANGRSLVVNRPNGFVKIIGDAQTNEVLGVHIIGAFATEMIGECAAVMKLEGCVEDIAHTIHAHPTVGESIMEAAEKYLGGAIHSL